MEQGSEDDMAAECMLLAMEELMTNLSLAYDRLQQLQRLAKHEDYELITEIFDRCFDLDKLLSELRQILTTYVRHAERSSQRLPLDPTLLDFLSNCSATVLSLKDRVEIQRDSHVQESSEAEWTVVSADPELEEDIISLTSSIASLSLDDDDIEQPHWDMKEALQLIRSNLDHLVDHLESFVPILRVDLDDFLAESVFPADSISDRLDERRSNTACPGFQELGVLRSSLYCLNDEIKANQALLNAYGFSFPEVVQPELKRLMQEQSAAILTLTEILTNHGSEWIDSMLAGKMSYGDFGQLDVLQFQDFTEKYVLRNRALREDADGRRRMLKVEAQKVDRENEKKRLETWTRETVDLNGLLMAAACVENEG